MDQIILDAVLHNLKIMLSLFTLVLTRNQTFEKLFPSKFDARP